MKVILLEDVKSLGKKGQLVDVSDGYARNFILAKKLGLESQQSTERTQHGSHARNDVGFRHEPRLFLMRGLVLLLCFHF